MARQRELLSAKRSMLVVIALALLISASQFSSELRGVRKDTQLEFHNNSSSIHSENGSIEKVVSLKQSDAAAAGETGVLRLLRNASVSPPKRPLMVLHIGPYKHGTTFLQCALSGPGYDLLRQDNFVYIGTCNCMQRREEKTREICIGHSSMSLRGTEENQPFNPELLQILPKLRNEGRNAMIVWEYLSDAGKTWVRKFVDLLQGWDLQVIGNYRPAYEFLPSFLGQVQRPYAFRQKYRVWPADGGSPILPFDVYSMKQLTDHAVEDRYLIAWQRLKKRRLHPTMFARKLWLDAHQNMTIIDMTQLGIKSPATGDPLLIHLFCKVILVTPTLCDAATNNKLWGGVKNSRFPINYDLLAVAAHNRGLIAKSVTRPVAWERIRHRQESRLNKTSTDFPSICPTNASMEELFRVSVAARSQLFPLAEDPPYRDRFLHAVHRKHFCHIDVNATLSDPGWVRFFSGLTGMCGRRKCLPMRVDDGI